LTMAEAKKELMIEMLIGMPICSMQENKIILVKAEAAPITK